MQLKPFALLIRTIDRTFPFVAAAILAITKGPNWALFVPLRRGTKRRFRSRKQTVTREIVIGANGH